MGRGQNNSKTSGALRGGASSAATVPAAVREGRAQATARAQEIFADMGNQIQAGADPIVAYRVSKVKVMQTIVDEMRFEQETAPGLVAREEREGAERNRLLADVSRYPAAV